MDITAIPTEVLIHLITIVLHTDPGAVARLALNRRMWDFVDKHWPQILRGQLYARMRIMEQIRPIFHDNYDVLSTDIAAVCAAMSPLYVRPLNAVCALRLIYIVDDRRIPLLAMSLIHDMNMYISLYNHSVLFETINNKYVPYFYQHDTTTTSYKTIESIVSGASAKIAVPRKIKQLLSKILPELLDMFDLDSVYQH